MKKVLIIGSAPDYILDSNMKRIATLFTKKDYELHLLVTKDYKNDLVDVYVDFPRGFIKKDMNFDLSQYDEFIVCQSGYVRADFLNIYMFLKNNDVNKTYVIYANDSIKRFNLKKINKAFLFLYKYLGFYKKLGF